MKKSIIVIISAFAILSSCSKVYDGKNVDPNNPTDVTGETLLRGIELANVTVQVSHLQRITGMWMQQYKGVTLLYKSLAEYNISGEEANESWQYVYQSISKQLAILKEKLPNDKIYTAIGTIQEANALGTAASLFGNIPFSQRANDKEFPFPTFDKQTDVFAGVQLLLDQAIASLNSLPSTLVIGKDIYAKSAGNWIKAANTLKARYYLETREYPKAYAAALAGINAPNQTWKFFPPALVADGDFNLLNTLIDQRGGYLATAGTWMHENLLKAGATGNRNNTKTNEDARLKYYRIGGSSATTEKGVAAKDASMPIATYEENLLILAEAGFRTLGFSEGLLQLNKLRLVLNTNLGLVNSLGVAIVSPTGGTVKYDAYVAEDFNAGAIENPGTLSPDKALLREIIEERYVSLYGTIMPFSDARRLRKSDNDVNVPIPFTNVTATKHPERIIYAQNEINNNPNIPSPVPDIYVPTPINQ